MGDTRTSDGPRRSRPLRLEAGCWHEGQGGMGGSLYSTPLIPKLLRSRYKGICVVPVDGHEVSGRRRARASRATGNHHRLIRSPCLWLRQHQPDRTSSPEHQLKGPVALCFTSRVRQQAFGCARIASFRLTRRATADQPAQTFDLTGHSSARREEALPGCLGQEEAHDLLGRGGSGRIGVRPGAAAAQTRRGPGREQSTSP